MLTYTFFFVLVAIVGYGAWKFSNWFADEVITMFEERTKNHKWIVFLVLMLIIVTII